MTNKKGKKVNNEILENCRGQPPRNNKEEKVKIHKSTQNTYIKLYCENAGYTNIKKNDEMKKKRGGG
jgi:hypothetical protein